MVIFNENFLHKLHVYMTYTIFILIIVMIVVKYRVYNLKREIREIENSIVKLSYSKSTLETELNYLTDPRRLNAIYQKLLNDKVIDKKIIVSSNNIKSNADLDNYYAEKYKYDKRTSIVSNGKWK